MMVGNIPNFTKIDLLRCFLRFGKNRGRQELAKELDLGEGTVRTILGALKSKKLLASTKRGHALSKEGKIVWNKIHSSVSNPENIRTRSFYPGFRKVGVLIRAIPVLKEVYKLRDIAVSNSADGAIILAFNKKLYAPEYGIRHDYKELEVYFDVKKHDVLAIAFAKEIKHAETGALAIAIELSPFVKKFINRF